MRTYYNPPKASMVGPILAVGMILAFVVIGGSFIYSMLSYADRPEVHISYETQECVKVVDHKAEKDGRVSEWSCDTLPPSYERVWVF